MASTVPCADRLSEAQRQLALILTHAGEGIYGLDKDGITTFVNNAAAKMVSLDLEQLQGMCNHSLVHHHHIDGSVYPKIECPIYATLQDGVARHGDDEYFCRADGTFFPIEYFVNPIIDNDKLSGAVVTFIDITDRKNRLEELDNYQTKLEEMVENKTQELRVANEELTKISLLDGLTNIANRRAFDDTLVKEIGRAARKKVPLTLMLGDVDYFKKYNDAYGHHEGDNCLKLIAHSMQETFKRAGDFVARYGGEELAAILPDMTLVQAEQQAQYLLGNIQQLNIPHRDSDCSDRVSMSLGIVHLIPEAGDSQRLIELADQAMYKAKSGGRNQYQVWQTDDI